METHGGVESMTGYVQRELAGTLRSATTWEGVHTALAAHGLEIRPRGAGLVIGSANNGVYVRASNVDRDLAMKAMTDRLGAFKGGRQSAGRTFKPRPMQQHVNSAALFAQYQRERQATNARRKEALAIVRTETAKHSASVRGWRKTQQAAMKAMPGGSQGKRIARATAAASAKQSIAAQRAEAAKARKRIAAELPVISWQTWLAEKANAGDGDALAVLRSREEREQQIRRDMLTAKDTAAARQVVMQNLSPRARKDGSIVYRTADGGMVIDRQQSVQAQKATTGAAFIALTLAAERFQGQALIVEGTDEFRAEVARLAGLKSVAVRFADADMEAQRQAAIPAPVTPTKPVPPVLPQTVKTPEKPPVSAVDAYIADRNKARERISSIDYNRRWGQGDAGPVKYLGRRAMSDGTEVVLLGRKGETLVKPVSSAVAAKAAGWKVGRMVTVDARGRFVDNSKAKGNER